jgi:hypothetical protein
VLRFRVRPDRPGTGPDVQIEWTYKVGSEWRSLGRSMTTTDRVAEVQAFGFVDGTRAFTEDGEIFFRVPDHWPRELFRSRVGRWLRAEVVSAGAGYATPPRLDFLDVTLERRLPTITAVSVRLARAPALRPAPAAAFGTSPIDLSKDFHPLGEEPRFNDTFQVAIPDALARPGEGLWVEIELTNPPGTAVPTAVRTDGNPVLTWEVWDGTAWVAATPVGVSGTNFTAANSSVVVTLPPKLGRTTVAGLEHHWLRARLTGGNYGVPATYEPVPAATTGGGGSSSATTSYRLVPATLAPPVIKSLKLGGNGPGNAVPATACVTRNDFAYADRSASVTSWSTPFTPFESSVERDQAPYLGFDQPFGNVPVTLYLQVDAPTPEDVAADRLADLDPSTLARLDWEYSGPDGWRSLGAVDETGTLGSSGLVASSAPAT